MAQKSAALFNSDHELKSQAHAKNGLTEQLELGHIHGAATQLINKLKVSESKHVQQFHRAKTAAWIFRKDGWTQANDSPRPLQEGTPL